MEVSAFVCVHLSDQAVCEAEGHQSCLYLITVY